MEPNTGVVTVSLHVPQSMNEALSREFVLGFTGLSVTSVLCLLCHLVTNRLCILICLNIFFQFLLDSPAFGNARFLLILTNSMLIFNGAQGCTVVVKFQ